MPLSQYTKPVLTNGEVLDIRRKVMAPEKVAKHDAEALMKLNEQLSTPTEAWKSLFTDAIVDYVHHLDPETEFSLLVKILNKANIISSHLEVYMLKMVKDAVLHDGRVSAEDVQMLRRIMYSVGGQGGIDISRQEAEVIYDIHDGTAHADNHDSWGDMFSKMMACYMMAGMSSLEVDENWAVSRDVWLNTETKWSIGGFLSGLAKGMSSFGKAKEENEAPVPFILDRDLQSSLEDITEEEAFWLIERINADERLTPSEAKMLMYLKQECPNLHSTLNEFIKSEVYG